MFTSIRRLCSSVGRRRKTNTPELLFQRVKNYNDQFTSILQEVGEGYRIQGNMVKHKGYDRAVKALTALPYKISSKEQAMTIPSIGKGIAEKIQIILDTNTLPQAEEMRNDPELQKIRLFSRIHGVGPAQAKKWVSMGFQTLEDLQAVKLTKYQQLGLKYLEEFEQRIPRAEMDVINGILERTLKELDSDIVSMVCGSYRRKLENSGDVDCIITHPTYTVDAKGNSNILKQVVEMLEQQGLITDRISLGKTKFMGVTQLNSALAPEYPQDTYLHRRLDIRLIPQENYWCGTFLTLEIQDSYSP